MALRRQHDFGLLALVGAEAVGCSGVDEAFDLARRCFDKAVGRYGFAGSQVFFDAVAVPLMKDDAIQPSGRSRTYIALRVMQRIKADRSMGGAHRLLRIGEAAIGLPGRAVGVCRAYVAKAMEHGMDSAFMNPASHFGESPADPKLLELVGAYAEMDGSPEKADQAKERMAKFCEETQKPRRPAPTPALTKP
jgi:hypothetical protein